jgi:mono/diheme cytochrome c family protein
MKPQPRRPAASRNTAWLPLWALSLGLAAAAPETDPVSGLEMAPGWELVRAHCTSCHSARQFLQSRGTRQTWDHVITWMEERGGLPRLEPAARTTIVDYLAAVRGPGKEFRRPPIPAHLMPVNPYVSEVRKAYEARPSGS